MGLGWDLALDMIDYTGRDEETTLVAARQAPRVLRTSDGSREVRLMNEDVLQYFDATAPEVPDEIEVADGRFSIAVVTAGTGSIDADVRSVASLRSQILVCGICGQATTLSQRGQGCVINPAKVGEHKEGGPGACEACPGHVLVRAMRSDSPTRRWHDLGDALPSFARRPGSRTSSRRAPTRLL